MILDKAIMLLKEFGFFDILLPMLLVFFIFHAILVKTEILGKTDKPVVKATNAIVSAIIAFIFVTQTGLVEVLNKILPRSALLLIITMIILLFLAFIGIYKTDTLAGLGGGKAWFVGVPLVLVFLGVLDASGLYIPGIHQVINFFTDGRSISVSQETIYTGLAILICAAVVGLIIWVINSSDK